MTKGLPTPWRFERPHGRIEAVLSCLCGASVAKPNPGDWPAEQLAKWFRRKGWAVSLAGGMQVRCPACQRPARARREIVVERTVDIPLLASTSMVPPGAEYVSKQKYRLSGPAPAAAETPPPVSPIAGQPPARPEQEDAVEGDAKVVELGKEPRELTPKEQRAVYAELEAHFDESAGLYRGGESDDAIADRLGVPRACVARLREVAFGPLKQDPEVAALQAAIAAAGAELGAMRNMLEEASRQYRELERRLDKLERERQRRGG